MADDDDWKELMTANQCEIIKNLKSLNDIVRQASDLQSILGALPGEGLILTAHRRMVELNGLKTQLKDIGADFDRRVEQEVSSLRWKDSLKKEKSEARKRRKLRRKK